MSAGKRREERTRAYELAGMVWQLTGEPLTQFELHEFMRAGAFPDPADRRLPCMPEVERKMQEIEANGGRLIVG